MTDFFEGLWLIVLVVLSFSFLLGVWDFSIPLFVVILIISIALGAVSGIYVFLIVSIIMSLGVVTYYSEEIDKKTKNTLEVQKERHNPVSTSKETTQTQKADLKNTSIKARKSLQGYPSDNDLLTEYRKIMGNNDAKGELNQTVDDIVEKEKDKENRQESKKIKSERNDVVKNNTEDKNNFEYDSNKSWVDNVKKYWSSPEFKSKVQFLNF